MVLRGRDGEDPVVFTCTPMRRSLCVCDCGIMFCFFFFSTSIIVTVWRMRFEGGGMRGAEGDWDRKYYTGAQEEWPLRQTLICQRDKTEYEWILEWIIVLLFIIVYIMLKICLDEQVNSQQYHCFVHCKPKFWASLLQLECKTNWNCYHWSGGVAEEAVITYCLPLGCYTYCSTHLRKSIYWIWSAFTNIWFLLIMSNWWNKNQQKQFIGGNQDKWIKNILYIHFIYMYYISKTVIEFWILIVISSHSGFVYMWI